MGDVQIEIRQADPTEEDSIRTFRDLTNRVVGRGLQIPDNNLLFFAHRLSHGGSVNLIVGAGSCRLAGVPSSALDGISPDPFICDGSCHVIEYIFVDQYYQRDGFGFQLLESMEKHCLQMNPDVVVRLYAAHKSRGFFMHCGYRFHGDPKTTKETNSSVHRFQNLHAMFRNPEWPRHNSAAKPAGSGPSRGHGRRRSGWRSRGSSRNGGTPTVAPV